VLCQEIHKPHDLHYVIHLEAGGHRDVMYNNRMDGLRFCGENQIQPSWLSLAIGDARFTPIAALRVASRNDADDNVELHAYVTFI
jgi:hypothetical protein